MDESGKQHGASDDPTIDVPKVPAGEDVPSHAAGTPRISDEEQRKGQTAQPAPEDDVGVPPMEEHP